ncbi:MAG: hypothetical protein ABIP54_02715, partial [Candidatus Andersenbacteria bacterium]
GLSSFFYSKKWGGWKSVLGRGVIFLGLGLLGEAFGQFAWTYYNVVQKIQAPYPSIADLGYSSIILFYSIAMLNFARASGVRFSLKDYVSKIQVVVVPVVMLIVSYYFFLRGYEFDWSNPLKIFLDFWYPMGDAVIISFAILTFTLSRQHLGGVMRNKIIYVIGAFIVQYVTDYTFLYRSNAGTYVNGGIVDLMYATSFVIMTVGIVSLGMKDSRVSKNKV